MCYFFKTNIGLFKLKRQISACITMFRIANGENAAFLGRIIPRWVSWSFLGRRWFGSPADWLGTGSLPH